jgi:hypothetical protein
MACVVLAALVLGCGNEVETLLTLGADTVYPCGATLMNSYQVEVFELGAPVRSGAEAAACSQCLMGLGNCILADRSCTCSESVPSGATRLQQALSGMRMDGLQLGERYCIRIVAAWFERGADDRCVCPIGLENLLPPGARTVLPPPEPRPEGYPPGSKLELAGSLEPGQGFLVGCAASREPTSEDESDVARLLFGCPSFREPVMPPVEPISMPCPGLPF